MEKNKTLLTSEIILIAIVLVLFAWFIFAWQSSKTPLPTPPPIVQTPIVKENPVVEKTPEIAPPVTKETTDAQAGIITKSSPTSISIKVNGEEKTFPISEKAKFVSIDPKKGLTIKKSSDAIVGAKVTVSFYSISKQAFTIVIEQ
jgi:hypothetical protein